MKRKWIAFIVALVVLTGITPALAATPSKTTEDLTRVTKVETEKKSGDALIWVEREASDKAQAQMDDIKSFVEKKNKPADYFPEETKTQITALTPKGTDLTTMKLNELVPLGIGNYKVEFGKVYCTLRFPTEFPTDKTVIGVVGYPGSDGKMIWLALETSVDQGDLRLVFPIELMEKIGHEAVLAVLSN